MAQAQLQHNHMQWFSTHVVALERRSREGAHEMNDHAPRDRTTDILQHKRPPRCRK